MFKIILILIYGLLSSLGMYFMKIGTLKDTSIFFDSKILKINLNINFIIGVIFYIMSFLMYMYLISKNNLSYIVPVATAVFYICILLISIFLLKENMTIYSGLGFALILLGAILLNVKVK